jgi:hypothetical protein
MTDDTERMERFQHWLDRLLDSPVLDVALASLIGASLAATLFLGLSQ